MEEDENIQKVCSFYVSTTHLTTMIFPYINKELKENTKFNNYLENNLRANIETIIGKLMLKSEGINDILKLNWNKTENIKYAQIEKEINENLKNTNKLNIFINGSKAYIENVNKAINKYFSKERKKIKQKNINIINCYEVGEFNKNIKEILDKHAYVLNTSGIHEISKVFEGYKKAN